MNFGHILGSFIFNFLPLILLFCFILCESSWMVIFTRHCIASLLLFIGCIALLPLKIFQQFLICLTMGETCKIHSVLVKLTDGSFGVLVGESIISRYFSILEIECRLLLFGKYYSTKLWP